MSWNLSPQDLLDAGYLPALWGVQKTTIRAMLAAILGHTPLDRLCLMTLETQKRAANAKRKRQPQVRYPVRSVI